MGFLSALNFPFDASVVLRKRKALRRELLARDISWLEKKIAVLGGSSTQDIVSTLEVFLLNEGIRIGEQKIFPVKAKFRLIKSIPDNLIEQKNFKSRNKILR